MSNIVDYAKLSGDFVCGADGFYVYWPKGQGALTEWDLYLLHRELVKMNAKTEEMFNEYFRNQQRSEASSRMDGGQACGEDGSGNSTASLDGTSGT